MPKQFFDWFKGQFTLAQEVAQLRRESNDLQRKWESHIELTRNILFTIERDRDHWRHEHEKVLLQLENELLKFERRLPPPRHPDDEPKLR